MASEPKTRTGPFAPLTPARAIAFSSLMVFATAAIQGASLEDLRKEAAQCFLDFQYQRSALVYSEILRQTPQDPAALLNRGRCYWKLGNPVLAREDFEKILVIEPNNPLAQRYLSMVAIAPLNHSGVTPEDPPSPPATSIQPPAPEPPPQDPPPTAAPASTAADQLLDTAAAELSTPLSHSPSPVTPSPAPSSPLDSLFFETAPGPHPQKGSDRVPPAPPISPAKGPEKGETNPLVAKLREEARIHEQEVSSPRPPSPLGVPAPPPARAEPQIPPAPTPGQPTATNDEANFLVNQGRDFWKTKNFPKAYEKFQAALKIDPGNKLAQNYLKMLQNYFNNPMSGD